MVIGNLLNSSSNSLCKAPYHSVLGTYGKFTFGGGTRMSVLPSKSSGKNTDLRLYGFSKSQIHPESIRFNSRVFSGDGYKNVLVSWS